MNFAPKVVMKDGTVYTPTGDEWLLALYMSRGKWVIFDESTEFKCTEAVRGFADGFQSKAAGSTPDTATN